MKATPRAVQHNSGTWILKQALLLLPLVSLSFLLGCKSTQGSPSAPTGSARITGNTPGQIAEAVVQVFTANGFLVAGKRPEKLVFEKPAGKFSNLAYGNWIGDVPVWRRVKVSIVPAGEATYELHCAAFNVRDKGGSTEEELKLSNFRTGPYQKLLNEVAARFKR